MPNLSAPLTARRLSHRPQPLVPPVLVLTRNEIPSPIGNQPVEKASRRRTLAKAVLGGRPKSQSAVLAVLDQAALHGTVEDAIEGGLVVQLFGLDLAEFHVKNSNQKNLSPRERC